MTFPKQPPPVLKEASMAVDNLRPFDYSLIFLQPELIRLHYVPGMNINESDVFGNTPLHWAVLRKDLQEVRKLLEQGADPDIKNRKNYSVLHYAIMQKNFDLVQILLDGGADSNLKDESDSTPLHLAFIQNNIQMGRLLISYGADSNSADQWNQTPLFRAILQNKWEFLKLLLESGADPNVQNNGGDTVLHWAAKGSNIDIINTLIDFGADVNRGDKFGQTPLFYAIKYSRIETMKTLLDRNADVNAIDEIGSSPLHYGIIGNNTEIIQLLLDYGANIDLKNCYNVTPLDYAILKFKDTSLDLQKALILQVLKLTNMKKFVCKENLKHLWLKAEHQDFESEIKLCEDEIKELKINTVCHNSYVSFYRLLTSPFDQIKPYLRNQSIVESLRNTDFKSRYPMHYRLIKIQVNELLVKANLFDSAFKIVFTIVNSETVCVPEICVNKIVSYFRETDVKYLVRSFGCPKNVFLKSAS